MRQFRIAGLIILSWALLVGCVTQRTTTNIKGDGSGTNDLRIGFSRQFLSFAGMGGGGGGSGDPVGQLLDQLNTLADDLPAEWNARSEPWESEDQEFKGTRLLMEFKDLAMLGEQFSAEHFGSSPLAGVFQQFEARREGGAFVIKATIDMSGAGEELGSEAEQMQSLLASGMLGDSKPELIWRVELPGEITDWTEQESAVREGNAVTYTFPLADGQTYEIEIRGKATTGLPLILAVGGLLALGLLAVGGGLWLNRRSRAAVGPQPAPGTAPLAGWGPPAPQTRPLSGEWPAAPPSEPLSPYAPPAAAPPSEPLPPYAPPAAAPPSEPLPPYAPPSQPPPADLGGREVLPTKSLGSFWDRPPGADERRD